MPTSAIDEVFGGANTVALSRIAAVATRCTHADLRALVDRAIKGGEFAIAHAAG